MESEAPNPLPFEFATIRAERLLLRPVMPGDLADLLAINGDDVVTRHLPYASWRDLDDAQAWLQRADTRLAAGEAAQWVVVELATGRVIGGCLLFHFDRERASADIGYVLARQWWRNGWMSEAVQALIGFAFGSAGLRVLEAIVEPENVASTRLLERFGFTRYEAPPAFVAGDDGPLLHYRLER